MATVLFNNFLIQLERQCSQEQNFLHRHNLKRIFHQIQVTTHLMHPRVSYPHWKNYFSHLLEYILQGYTISIFTLQNHVYFNVLLAISKWKFPHHFFARWINVAHQKQFRSVMPPCLFLHTCFKRELRGKECAHACTSMWLFIFTICILLFSIIRTLAGHYLKLSIEIHSNRHHGNCIESLCNL